MQMLKSKNRNSTFYPLYNLYSNRVKKLKMRNFWVEMNENEKFVRPLL